MNDRLEHLGPGASHACLHALSSPVGVIYAAIDLQGRVVYLGFRDHEPRTRLWALVLARTSSLDARPEARAELEAQLGEYFAGHRKAFTLPLALEGTAFQQRVWAALQGIPYGQTRSYGELAHELGCPGAARAIGAANGANPVSILVPCHRVIGARGALVGYAGGADLKAALLRREGARP